MRPAAAGRSPRVVHVIDRLSAGAEGGAERFALELAVALDTERFQRLFVATRFDPRAIDDDACAALERLHAGEVAFVGLPRKRRLDLRAWWRLFKLLRTVDVAHAHKYGSNLWVSVIGRIARVPVVIAHEHSWSYSGNRLRALLDRFVISRLADVVVAVSQQDADRMVAIERIDARKIHLIANGIPSEGIVHPDAVRAELDIGTAPVICAVCGLRPEKALDVLIAAFRLVADSVPDAHLVVAGHGPEREWLDELVRQMHLEGRAHLLGARTDTASVIEAADVCVLSSDREGLPLAIMEYMERSKPIVATRVGGIPEMLAGGAGIVVPPRDSEALAKQIVRVLEDEEVAAALAGKAHDTWRGRYSVERVATDFAHLYTSLLSRRQMRSGSLR